MPKGPQGQKRPADTVALMDAVEGEPKKRGPYKPRQPAEISK